MTTSRANLLAGVDMEGGENFCDSIYNFLKNQGKDINLFTNSGIGAWFESDTNKGLAVLPFDSGSVAPVVGETLTDPLSGATGKVAWLEVTGGTWGGTNAAGNISLGAVTGTFQDNSDITGSVGGANMLTVNGDATIGIRNDPMNNNSVGLWTDDGGGITLAFVAAEYTVTTTAANQRAWIAAAALTAGKLYKIELDINDGTDSGIDIQGYFDDGAAQYGRIMTTVGGWVSVSWTFLCATTTAAGLVGFRVIDDMTGSNIQIRRFSCYEITPCCTADDNKSFDGWYQDAQMDTYREHWGVNTKDGSFYALAVVPSGAGVELTFNAAGSSREEWYAQFQSRPVTVGAWVLAYTASHCRIRMEDTAGSTYSDYHTGSGDYEWLEVTRVIDAAATDILAKFQFNVAGDVDGTTIVYISQPMFVFGWSLGEGMYQPRQQEIIYPEGNVFSNALHNLKLQSTSGWVPLNPEADSDARMPKGTRAFLFYSEAQDSGSAAGLAILQFGNPNTTYINNVSGIANDLARRICAWQIVDNDGGTDYYIGATGANTFDCNTCTYRAVQIN